MKDVHLLDLHAGLGVCKKKNTNSRFRTTTFSPHRKKNQRLNTTSVGSHEWGSCSRTVVGECFEQTVQAALHTVGGAVRGHQLQLLQSFTQVVCKQRRCDCCFPCTKTEYKMIIHRETLYRHQYNMIIMSICGYIDV